MFMIYFETKYQLLQTMVDILNISFDYLDFLKEIIVYYFSKFDPIY